MLLNAIHDAIIGIGTFVTALEAPKAGVFSQTQCQTESMAHLFQLGDHTIRNAWNNLCQENVHQRLENVQLVLNTEVDKVGI